MNFPGFFFGLVLVKVTAASIGNKDPNYVRGRTTMVHLFEWKWNDIAQECEEFLGPNGYGGVQISPPNENLIIRTPINRPWWERYQPMSYRLETRSGTESEFAQMVWRCNRANVRIYADAIINHMTGTHEENIGTGGSTANFSEWSYPAVPYTKENFNYPVCDIIQEDYTNSAANVRDCELVGLKDLNQTLDSTREKIVEYMNKLIDYGVAGFRIDAAKHMWPEDLAAIYSRLNKLNRLHGFKSGWRYSFSPKPFIFQEVIDLGNESVSRDEYTNLSVVTEFRFGAELSRVFRGNNDLKWLINWGPEWNLLESDDALTFIDNHDNQRGHGSGGSILTYKEPKQYIGATAFMLAHPYGIPNIMSSYAFNDSEIGPPMDSNDAIISRTINEDGSCGNGWVCEHRWPEIVGMVQFRNIAAGSPLTDWWDNGANQIAFCRGNVSFIAFNNDEENLDSNLQTCLSPGTYCDIITGGAKNGECTGKSVVVDQNGYANISIGIDEENMVSAIHIGAGSKL